MSWMAMGDLVVERAMGSAIDPPNPCLADLELRSRLVLGLVCWGRANDPMLSAVRCMS